MKNLGGQFIPAFPLANGPGVATPQTESQLAAAIRAQKEATDLVFIEVGLLLDRLSPVLFPAPPETCGNEKGGPPPVPLLQDIDATTERLRMLAEILTSARDRLVL